MTLQELDIENVEQFINCMDDDCPICGAKAIIHTINCDLAEQTWECLVCGSTFSY